jgi:ATP-binding cassette subfamily G (WHITE) protein 2 (SNQ2)
MEKQTVPHTDVPLADVPLHYSTMRNEPEGKTYEAINDQSNRNGSGRTASIDDSTARGSSRSNEKGFSNVKGGVNVQRAEAEFAELSKELSRSSNISRRLSRVQSRQSRKDQTVSDVEKGGVATSDDSSEEEFDLEKTLRGSREEEEAAGIKSKRIGVVWDDLTVSGVGMYTRWLHVCASANL